jgi:hypothetical protein
VGGAMGDRADNERIVNEVKILTEELEKFANKEESAETIGPAIFEYILGRERIRRNAISPGPRQDAVDYETVETLQSARLRDTRFVEIEAILRRIGDDPVEAVQYFEQLITQKAKDLSEKQTMRAKKPRPRRRSHLSQMIDEIVLGDPNITENRLKYELLSHSGIKIIDDELRDTTNSETIKVKGLKDYLSRAKERISH